jgi:hypothetical protein
VPQRFPNQRPIAENLIDAIAKTVAELTSQQDGLIRQQVIEHLTRWRSWFQSPVQGAALRV